MNEYRPQMESEIASLQARADQLETANSTCRLRLESLAAEADVARSSENELAVQRVQRRMQVEQQRALRITGEIRTLIHLIAARRSQAGLDR